MIITDLFESNQSCPECGGPAFSDLVLAEKKDACYYKVKASAKVWPSAYASGRLVQCRKKGAANYGKSKNEGVTEGYMSLGPNRIKTLMSGPNAGKIVKDPESLQDISADDFFQKYPELRQSWEQAYKQQIIQRTPAGQAAEKAAYDKTFNDYSWMTPEEKAEYERLQALDAGKDINTRSYKAEKYLKQLFQKKTDAKKAASMLKVHWAPLSNLPKYLKGQVSPKIELSAYLAASPQDLGKVRWGTGTVGIVLDGHITIAGRGDLGSDQYKMTAGQRGQQKYTSRPGQIDPGFSSIDLGSHHEVMVDNWKIKEIVLPADIPQDIDNTIKQYGIPVRRLQATQGVAEGYDIDEFGDDYYMDLIQDMIDRNRRNLSPSRKLRVFAAVKRDIESNGGIFDINKFNDAYKRIIDFSRDMYEQGVAEGKVIHTYLWHGSRQKIPMLEPRQAVDTGGAAGSNQNAIYATSDPIFAIQMGMPAAGSDYGHFPNDSQMVLFSGKIRKGEYVYLHKLPFNGPDGKPQFVQGGNSREFHSIPGVQGIEPMEIKEIPVNRYLSLIRKATPADWKLRKKYMKKQGMAESDTGDTPIESMTAQELAAYLNMPVDQVKRDIAGAREMARDQARDTVGEDMADDLLKMAQKISPAARLRGTSDQERDRTQDMLAQRDQARQSRQQTQIQADRERLPELQDQLQSMIQQYQNLGGDSWRYADSEQNLSSSERQARAMVPAIQELSARVQRAKQGMTEGSLEAAADDPVVVILDPAGKHLDKLALSSAVQKYRLGTADAVKKQLANQDYTKIGQYTIQSPMTGQAAVAEHINRMRRLAGVAKL